MTKIHVNVILTAFSLWTFNSVRAEFPVLGLDITCVPSIEPAQCLSLARAAATAPLAPRDSKCEVKGCLSAVKALGPDATAFCSSYLDIPSASTVSTIVTPPAVTNTIFETHVSTVTVLTPIGFKRSVEQRTCGPRRGGPTSSILKYDAKDISAACECLNITPTSTETVTITGAPPPPSIFTITTNVITTITTCVANGGHCECLKPGDCCGGACSCNDVNGSPVSTCFGF